jgi:hypothetical protein
MHEKGLQRPYSRKAPYLIRMSSLEIFSGTPVGFFTLYEPGLLCLPEQWILNTAALIIAFINYKGFLNRAIGKNEQSVRIRIVLQVWVVQDRAWHNGLQMCNRNANIVSICPRPCLFDKPIRIAIPVQINKNGEYLSGYSIKRNGV